MLEPILLLSIQEQGKGGRDTHGNTDMCRCFITPPYTYPTQGRTRDSALSPLGMMVLCTVPHTVFEDSSED